MPDLTGLATTAAGGALNPLSLIPAATQTGFGLFQTLFSGKGKAQKELERQAAGSPIYRGSKPISDYYEEAKNRYNVSPYQSNLYQLQKQNAERTAASALNSLYGRGSALAGAGRIAAVANDALLKAGATAEQERNQRFGQYGTATGMKSGDEMKQFQINQLDPYNRKYQLAMMKAGSAASKGDAGLSNIYGGVGNLSMLGSEGAFDGIGTGAVSRYKSASNQMNNILAGIKKNGY